MGWGHYLFGFHGRITRARFWLFLGLATALGALLLLAFWFYALSIPGAYENGGPTPFPTDPAGIAAASAFFALLALMFVSFLAVSVKRLHDRDKSWWWVLILVILPHPLSGLGSYLRDNGGNDSVTIALWVAALVIGLWGFVELALLPGVKGSNRFGPDPLAPPI